jgi:uncharacterized protein (DUF2267 family)
MRYDQFVQKVQEYAGLENKEEAVKVIKATLETMSERMPRTHREHLAAQLPGEMKDLLPKHQHMKYLLLEEFYRRIADRADISFHHAVKYAEAVARVIREAVAPGELEDILSVFPDEYNELFGRKPASPLSPSSII